MNPIRQSEALVSIECPPRYRAKKDGAFGKRKFARGNWLYDRKEARRRPCVELTGEALVQRLINEGRWEEAEQLMDLL